MKKALAIAGILALTITPTASFAGHKNCDERKIRPMSDLDHCNLENANLDNARLSEAKLSNTNLRGANLKNADLRGANLKNANLLRANLKNANLRNAKLTGGINYSRLKSCPKPSTLPEGWVCENNSLIQD